MRPGLQSKFQNRVPSSGSEGSHGIQKAGKDGINKGVMFQSQKPAELCTFSHVVLALESRREEGLWSPP